MNEIAQLKLKYDASDMHGAIASFPQQIQDSFSIFKNWNPVNPYDSIKNILILGMGGSAIGGDVCRVLLQNDSSIPISVNRSYNIPRWVDETTLVIASSYSGNTEETLSAFDQCIESGALIVALTTGGKLCELSQKYKLDHIILPSGMQPRAALGYSVSLLLLLFNKLGFCSDDIINNLKNAIDPLDLRSQELSVDNPKNPAVILAKQIQSYCPVIYGSEDLTWVAALRFKGQLEENAKTLAFHHHIPEQNHNEIEGWSCYPELLSQICIIWLEDDDDHPRSKVRMKVTQDILSERDVNQIEIFEIGKSPIMRLLKLIHLLDWSSYYIALLNAIDPTPVDRITQLKTEMAKL